MRIRKIQLKNGYKRFFDLTIDLGEKPGRIVALVGPNGCGKSSVLDGMLFLANAYGRIGQHQPRDHAYHSMTQAPIDYQNVLIEFSEGNFQRVRSTRQKMGKENTIFSFRSPYRYNDLMIKAPKAVPELSKNDYGATVCSDLDDKMDRNYRQLNIKYYKYLHEKDCTPSQAKAAIIGDLNKSIQNCLNIEVSSLGNIEATQGTIYFKKPDQKVQFGFNVLSAGEKEVVDLLLDMYLRKDDFDDSVFLLDEPELHINTAIQRKLLLEINRLLGEGCQLWVATHSMGFLRALQGELKDECQVIDFGSASDLATTAQTFRPMVKSAARWRAIFAVALDDLAELVSPRRIVYCEGRDTPSPSGAERGMDAKVYNAIFNAQYHDTLFISSGGNTELDQRSDIAIAILSKVFSSLEILVVKDRDMASGKQTTESDRQMYLKNNPTSHRVLRRWEIENYLYDKEVLRKFCAENQTSFDEASYDRFVTDVVNQNLKGVTGRMKNFCGIISSVNAESFKLALAGVINGEMGVYKELEDCIFNRA